MVITRTKEQIFRFIKENFKKRLESWRKKHLNITGKEVMLKIVTMALPTYAISDFKLPKKLCSSFLNG